MKISTAPISRFLTQHDLPAPLVLTMDCVTRDEALNNPVVLHFTANQVKPLPLNLTNIRSIVAAYGDETTAWHGKMIEVYADPAITNTKGQRTGGVRIRIPAAPVGTGPRNGHGSSARPAAPAPPATPAPLTLAQRHAQVLAGFAGALTQAKVREWEVWRQKFDFTPEQNDEQSDACHAAMERTAPPAEKVPVPARGAGAGIGSPTFGAALRIARALDKSLSVFDDVIPPPLKGKSHE